MAIYAQYFILLLYFNIYTSSAEPLSMMMKLFEDVKNSEIVNSIKNSEIINNIKDLKLVNDLKHSVILSPFFNGEACSTIYILNFSLYELQRELKNNVFGQELAVSMLFDILNKHFTSPDRKALCMSFNGMRGTGKNLVVDILIHHIYRKGVKSRFVHRFSSRIHFDDDQSAFHNALVWIRGNLTDCKLNSMFIFDEAELLPNGVLLAIEQSKNYPNAIFILLFSKGGIEIMEHFKYLSTPGYFLSGKSRNMMVPDDFSTMKREHKMNMVDHFIPFLPLGKVHLIQCIEREFHHVMKQYNNRLSLEVIQDYVLPSIHLNNYGYSVTGCKSIKSKVSFFVESMLNQIT